MDGEEFWRLWSPLGPTALYCKRRACCMLCLRREKNDGEGRLDTGKGRNSQPAPIALHSRLLLRTSQEEYVNMICLPNLPSPFRLLHRAILSSLRDDALCPLRPNPRVHLESSLRPMHVYSAPHHRNLERRTDNNVMPMTSTSTEK
jgi:hypothetical protein